MIPRAAFEQALPLAQKLADKGIELAVVTGSPMQDLIEHCSVYGIHANGGSFEEVDMDTAIQHLVNESSFARSDNIVEHSQAMMRCVDLAIPAVRRSLDYARNVVVPEINEMLSVVDQAVRGVMSRRRDPFTVVPVVVPALMRNSNLHEMVERFSQTTISPIKSKKVVEFAEGDVRELLATGAGGFDTDVGDMIDAGKDYAWFPNLLAEFWRGGCELDAIPTFCQPLLFVMARAMYDNPPTGCLMGLADYNNYVSQVIAQAGRSTFSAIENSSNDRRLTRLYVSTPAMPKGETGYVGCIYVNADVYNDLVEKGLTPEALYGNEYGDRSILPSELLLRKDELVESYKRQRVFNDRRNELEEFNVIKDVISDTFKASIAARAEGSLVVSRETYYAALSDAMQMVIPPRMANLSALVRDMVCAVFHRHTDAVRYLQLIDEIGKGLDEETKVREVALMATIEYITIWVARQLIK